MLTNSPGPRRRTLGGLLGWPASLLPLEPVVARPARGDAPGRLELSADPDGPLGLASRDGSLGGLVLPRGFAFDRDRLLYLLARRDDKPAVLRFRPHEVHGERFVPLPLVGGAAEEPRGLVDPRAIAIHDNGLFIADRRRRRVVVFTLDALALRAVWQRRESDWRPIDLAAHPGGVYVLCPRAVYAWRPGRTEPEKLFRREASLPNWKRIVVHPDGRLCLLTSEWTQAAPATRQPVVEVRSARRGGAVSQRVHDPEELRPDFPPPPLFLREVTPGGGQWFCLPASLTRPCGREWPEPPPCVERPWLECLLPKEAAADEPGPGPLLFTRNGCRVPDEDRRPSVVPLYRPTGTGNWITPALDSGIYRCPWHRVELTLSDLPPGNQVEVLTLTADEEIPAPEVAGKPDGAWQTHFVVAGAPDEADARGPRRFVTDGLVRSNPGRYLWLKLILRGDRFSTPRVEQVALYYPRDSFARYLPPVFRLTPEARDFLERFLAIFQTEWEALEQTVDDLPGLSDPRAVPAGPMLEYLAGWLGVTFEGDWNDTQRRNLLRAAPGLLSAAAAPGQTAGAARLGTPGTLRDTLRVYLQNLTGIKPADQATFPVIVEGFRQRRFLALARRGEPLAGRTPVWGQAFLPRARLDEDAALDEARLISTGDPDVDLYNAFAHRFTVYLPAGWLSRPGAGAMLRRVLDAEKPAHTHYELCPVAGGLRLGVRATLGLDAVVGGAPRVTGADPEGGGGGSPLGGGAVLTAGPEESNRMRLVPPARLGSESVIN